MEDIAKKNGKDNGVTTKIFAMNTVMNMTIYGESIESAKKILAEAEQEIYQLEALFSATMKNSDISYINENAGKSPVKVSEQTITMIEKAKEIQKLTNGAFDITVSPVVKAWGFTTRNFRVPKKEEITKLISYINSDWITINKEEQTVFLEKPGMAIDLGGIAKGYTADYLSNWFEQKGVASGILSLGGNVIGIGLHNGNKWGVALQDPLNENASVGILKIGNQSVVTSGGYQRNFEKDGKIYHHIINPKTGYPAEEGLISVTIISSDGTKADGLSTALFVMGIEQAVDFWRQSNDFEAIFITEDRRVLATEGIADDFQFTGESQGYQYSTIFKK
ncbi:MAG: FAD:protein FMN transferase [Epulopiscium sp.]|nr:FAD:protein FMN transferase [Candidatus Epulonipiscium sp.]